MGNFAEGFRRAISSKALVARKNSPHILFAVGIAGVIGGTVLACRATLKLDKKIDEFKTDVDDVKAKFDPQIEPHSYNHAIVRTYATNTYNIAKLYALPTGVMLVSIGCLSKSHTTLTKRNTALMSAYALVSTAFENYRERIRQEIGDDRELEIYHELEKPQIEEGSDKEIQAIRPNGWSPYARFFDQCSSAFEKDPETNRMFILAQEHFLNHKLRLKGHVFLNEAYEQLGFEHTVPGSVVGWIYDSKDGDGYIDFGVNRPYNDRFLNGWEQVVLLDFNVDGVIWDKI
jgi:hypothetical protein